MEPPPTTGPPALPRTFRIPTISMYFNGCYQDLLFDLCDLIGASDSQEGRVTVVH
jgi:hypothetical protein